MSKITKQRGRTPYDNDQARRVRVQVLLTEKEAEELDQIILEASGMTRSTAIRALIVEYLNRIRRQEEQRLRRKRARRGGVS